MKNKGSSSAWIWELLGWGSGFAEPHLESSGRCEVAGQDGSAGGIWHQHGKLSHGMEVLEAAQISGMGGALSLEGKEINLVLCSMPPYSTCVPGQELIPIPPKGVLGHILCALQPPEGHSWNPSILGAESLHSHQAKDGGR